MKILLTAVNAKFIHSNPAVYSLCACVDDIFRPCVEIAEYTVNNREEEILADIYRRKPDVIAFSCYIWNWSMIGSLIMELPKILPDISVWLGGPEVSYDPEAVLGNYPAVSGIMIGEGEETFRELTQYYCGDAARGDREKDSGAEGDRKNSVHTGLDAIRGIVYRTWNDEICHTPVRELTDISALPFLYDDLRQFENKIIYYESSRGCPYRCSYCLSSIDKKVRLRDIDIVKKELRFFLDNKVKQVKFVDRTFNCDHEHAKEIWRYLAEHDNGVTNFHFEIAADIMTEEELQILAGMRPGLVQLEIGVQTVNPETLKEIRRTADIDKIRRVVKRIEERHNIHVHLDLIAGLPYENYESFVRSFNSVYEMRPQQLQLGFLKVLKGSY
ncbi:MAG: B12-binding domain-containing radical SAM protein, partial [Lachnospiraceae bacterium]|nr:B12-binding domain-containing radical SAM protein [Lachnospiraceae bacterium]